MRYDYTNAKLGESDIQHCIDALDGYRKEIIERVVQKDYTAPEAALVTPFDHAHRERAEEISRTLGTVRHVVLVGIGGSSAGTEAVYQALRTKDSPTLHVLDVLNAEHLGVVIELVQAVSLTDLAIVIVSKSGTTIETVANADALLSALKGVHGDALFARVVCVGDEGTPLAEYAKKRGAEYAVVPSSVGGRFSVFTAAGLVPLALLGVSIREFVVGAAEAVTASETDDNFSTLAQIFNGVLAITASMPQEDVVGSVATSLRNTAVREIGSLMASVTYVLRARAGDRLHVLFAEDARLDGFLRWYQQLLAESLGKDTTVGGVPLTYGMAPLSMTPRELHSTAQLYLSGFKGAFTTFVQRDAEGEQDSYSISTDECGAGISLADPRLYARIPHAIAEGVHRAYTKRGLPFSILNVGTLSPRVMGFLLAEKMIEVMYTAHLLKIDAFDQPHVELYKKEIRQVLDGQNIEKPKPGVYVLFDIGGTKTRVAVSVDLETIEATAKFSTPTDFAEGVAHIIAEAERLLAGRAVRAIAGGIRGTLNKEHTGLVSDKVLKDWVEKPLAEELGRAFGAPVHLENDAALGGLGEACFGAGKGYGIVAYHTVSTGVGGARIVHGIIDTTDVGFDPGQQVLDIDHTVHPELQSGGTLEELISGEALEKRTGKKPYETPQSDSALWDELASYLAYGLRNTIVYWSPNVIVLGGSMIVGDPRILREDIERHTKAVLGDLPCPLILDATLKDEGGLYGAIAFLKQKIAP